MNELPLEGVRVCDFTWAIVGPVATQMLGAMGAEVIKIESYVHTDINRRGGAYMNGEEDVETTGNFHRANMSKKSCTLDLTKPEGVTIAKDIIRKSDIVVSNFRNGIMERFGLGKETIQQLKPDIIIATSTSMGNTGPMADYVGYNEEAYSYGGLGNLTGYQDGPPSLIIGDFADYMTGTLEVFAILSALHHRTNTGKGQTVEISMAEAVGTFIPEPILDYGMNRRIHQRDGNHMPGVAPHNCFRCRGEDSWVALAVTDEEQWTAFRNALGNPKWAMDEKFQDSRRRWENQEELEKHIEGWTMDYTAQEVTELLQDAGVPSGPSLCLKEVVEDPHLKERGFFVAPEHPVVGKATLGGLPWKSNVTQPVFTHAPLLGQDNYEIFHDLLGISDEEIARLIEQEIIN